MGLGLGLGRCLLFCGKGLLEGSQDWTLRMVQASASVGRGLRAQAQGQLLPAAGGGPRLAE